MKAKFVLGVAASLLAMTSFAGAATLEAIKGDVLVSKGKGFAPVSGVVELLPGDRVKMGAKGSARLVYGASCGVSVPANALVTVSKQSPCSFKAQAGGGDPLGGVVPSLFGLPPTVVGLGALGAIGLGVGLGVGLSGGGTKQCTLVPVSGGALCL